MKESNDALETRTTEGMFASRKREPGGSVAVVIVASPALGSSPTSHDMSTLGKVLWVVGAAAFALWWLVAFFMGWRWVWRRRQSINKNMATLYRQYGEDYRPVGPLRWAWIVVQSI